MNREYFIFILLFFLAACCEKDTPSIITDENGVIVSQPWLWRTKLNVDTYIGGVIDGPAFYKEVALMGAMDENNIAYLSGLDINTGEIVWKQDYVYQLDFFGFHNPFLNENRVTNIDGHDVFQLDLNNGNYLWKKRIENEPAAWLSGLDSLFFAIAVEPYPENSYPVESGYFGNIDNGDMHLFLIPDLGELPEPDFNRVNISLGGFRYLKPFYDEQSNKTMLLCYYQKNYYLAESDEQISKSYIGLYNFTEREWIYERIELGDFNFLEGFTPTIVGNLLYHTLSGGVVECRDLNSGELIWRRKDDTRQYSYKGFLIVEDKMIVMDDAHRKLIAFNTNTGNEIWTETSAPNINHISELNGVVYYSSYADGRIHAVDIETGRHLWLLKSPDSYEDSMNTFLALCTVIPGINGEKGKIVVSSFSHGYCYEAAK